VGAGILAAVLVAAITWGPIALTPRAPVDLLQPGIRTGGGDVVERDFGDGSVTRRTGYDGQSIYLIARFLPDLDAIGEVHNGPRYRTQRILLPALAAPAPAGLPTLVALQVWSLLGVGLGGWALARLASAQQLPAFTGALAALPLAIPQWLTTTEAFASGLLLAATVALERERLAVATALFAAAGLARESFLLAPLLVAVLLFLTARRRDSVVLAVGSIMPAFAWWVFLHSYFDTEEATSGALTGLLGAGQVQTDSVVAAAVALVLCATGTLWWRRRATTVAAVCGSFLVSALIFGSVNPEAILRVPAPGLCLGILATMAIAASLVGSGALAPQEQQAGDRPG
jgi:hypothetical protein